MGAMGMTSKMSSYWAAELGTSIFIGIRGCV